MQYIKGMQFYQNDKKTAITLGKFDGLHRGHETLIERVIEHQKNDGVDSVVFAFDMSPLYEKIKKKKESLITNEERAGRLFWQGGLPGGMPICRGSFENRGGDFHKRNFGETISRQVYCSWHGFSLWISEKR